MHKRLYKYILCSTIHKLSAQKSNIFVLLLSDSINLSPKTFLNNIHRQSPQKLIFQLWKYKIENVYSLIRYILRRKKASLWLLCDVQHWVIMAGSLMSETQIIVIIFITYSSYFLEFLVYIAPRRLEQLLVPVLRKATSNFLLAGLKSLSLPSIMHHTH